METKKKKKVCCICGKEFNGWGNNPYPVKEDGECCRVCNISVVLPRRIKLMNERLINNYRNGMKELEWLKKTIKTETAHLEQDAYIELLRNLRHGQRAKRDYWNFQCPIQTTTTNDTAPV